MEYMMTTIPPLDICVDAYPPGEIFDPRQRPNPVVLRSTSPNELALAKYKMWQAGNRARREPGQTLRISFLDGDAALREEIEAYAREWLEYANLSFVFGRFPDAEIRITTVNRDGYWSKVGIDAQKTAGDKPTMGLGGPQCNLALEPDGVKGGVVLRVRHAIGCVHEQAARRGDLSKPNMATTGGPSLARGDCGCQHLERYKPAEHIESGRSITSSCNIR
jgi:hypothetical protein